MRIALLGLLAAVLLVMPHHALAEAGANVATKTRAGATVRTGLTDKGVVYGDATVGAASTAAMTNGQLIVGQTSAAPLPKTVSGDATMAASGALTVTGATGDFAIGGNITQTGATTVSTGTGTFTHNGSVTLATGKNFTLPTVTAGTVALVSGTPSTATVTVTAGSKCICGANGGSAAIAAAGCAAGVSSTTLTLTGPNSVTTTVGYFCWL